MFIINKVIFYPIYWSDAKMIDLDFLESVYNARFSS